MSIHGQQTRATTDSFERVGGLVAVREEFVHSYSCNRHCNSRLDTPSQRCVEDFLIVSEYFVIVLFFKKTMTSYPNDPSGQDNNEIIVWSKQHFIQLLIDTH